MTNPFIQRHAESLPAADRSRRVPPPSRWTSNLLPAVSHATGGTETSPNARSRRSLLLSTRTGIDGTGNLNGARASSVRAAAPWLYLVGVGNLLFAELNGTAGPLGFFDCLGFFFSLLLRS
jgi:hypothetical protein